MLKQLRCTINSFINLYQFLAKKSLSIITAKSPTKYVSYIDRDIHYSMDFNRTMTDRHDEAFLQRLGLTPLCIVAWGLAMGCLPTPAEMLLSKERE